MSSSNHYDGTAESESAFIIVFYVEFISPAGTHTYSGTYSVPLIVQV